MALRRTLRTSALPFRYWACPRPWRGPCGDGSAPIGVHSCQEGKGYTSGGFAWCRGLGLAVLERWHHGEWDACGDGGAWRTRMHPRVSRYHQLARLTRFRGAERGANGDRHWATMSSASWLFGRRWATSGGGSVASYKRGVTGSNPVAPTRSAGMWYLSAVRLRAKEESTADVIGLINGVVPGRHRRGPFTSSSALSAATSGRAGLLRAGDGNPVMRGERPPHLPKRAARRTSRASRVCGPCR